MLKKYIQIFILIIFWLILTEQITLERLVIGLVVCYVVFRFNMPRKISKTPYGLHILRKTYYLSIYLIILIKEIFIANFHVAKIVLSPKMNISPETITFKTNLKSDLNKTILANSITLTPGTITVSYTGNIFKIHCLEKDRINEVFNLRFEKILLKVEELSL
ncbi:Na+/H+ antiporter subunit E [Sporosalibacterium faouarense]|uniref:Na+/H+ antiporter subunit E n=1 Tax=Sporosalibacterium faouarense TaxID=516123 RepID=UPI00192AD2A5|nr:Na+/H+ antiporter subunit E [Sporosalibacterium faouarense]